MDITSNKNVGGNRMYFRRNHWKKALQSIGFYNEEGLLANGALLFADDYQGKKTEIQVDMFKDRLEISSPGSFYRGEKLGKTYELSGIISKRGNSLITAVLVSCNVMEAAGTGFNLYGNGKLVVWWMKGLWEKTHIKADKNNL